MNGNKVLSKFSINTVNGIPIIKTLLPEDKGNGFVVTLSGNSIMENTKNILKYAYDGLGEFSEGFIRVRRGVFWGYSDLTLDEVVRPDYDQALNVVEGFAAVKQGDKWGYLKMAGCAYPLKWTELEFESAALFSNGMAKVMRNGLYGYVSNERDNINAIPCKYEEAYDFNGEGNAVVKIHNKYGMINKGGDFILSPQFDKYYITSRYNSSVNKYYNAVIGDRCYSLHKDGTYDEVL